MGDAMAVTLPHDRVRATAPDGGAGWLPFEFTGWPISGRSI